MARDIATLWSHHEHRKAVAGTAAEASVPPPRLNFPLQLYGAQLALMQRLLAIDRTDEVQALAKQLRDSGALLRMAGMQRGDGGSAATPSRGSGSGAASPPAPPTAPPAAVCAPPHTAAAAAADGLRGGSRSPQPAPASNLQAALEAAAVGPAAAAGFGEPDAAGLAGEMQPAAAAEPAASGEQGDGGGAPLPSLPAHGEGQLIG